MDACPTLSDLEKLLLRTLYRWQFQAAETLAAIPWFCLEAEHWGEKGLAVRRALNKLCTHKLVAQTETYPPDGVYVTPSGKRVEVERDISTMGEVEPSGNGFSVRLPANTKAVESYELTSAGIEAGQTFIKAGEAFLETIQNDPAARTALSRAQERLRAFAAAMKTPEFGREQERARQEQQRALAELAEAIRETARLTGGELAARGFSLPEALEDWEHLARIVEMPFETIQSGNFTARDVYVMALAWVDRQKIKSKLAADSNAPTSTKPTASKADPATPAPPVHNADFTMVNWYGREYHFALGIQSSAVAALWAEWEKSGLGLHQDTIRNAVDAERDSFRMDTAFRNHPAFGPMIQRCGDGRYKLAPPTVTPAPEKKENAGITAKSRRKRA